MKLKHILCLLLPLSIGLSACSDDKNALPLLPEITGEYSGNCRVSEDGATTNKNNCRVTVEIDTEDPTLLKVETEEIWTENGIITLQLPCIVEEKDNTYVLSREQIYTVPSITGSVTLKEKFSGKVDGSTLEFEYYNIYGEANSIKITFKGKRKS